MCLTGERRHPAPSASPSQPPLQSGGRLVPTCLTCPVFIDRNATPRTPAPPGDSLTDSLKIRGLWPILAVSPSVGPRTHLRGRARRQDDDDSSAHGAARGSTPPWVRSASSKPAARGAPSPVFLPRVTGRPCTRVRTTVRRAPGPPRVERATPAAPPVQGRAGWLRLESPRSGASRPANGSAAGQRSPCLHAPTAGRHPAPPPRKEGDMATDSPRPACPPACPGSDTASTTPTATALPNLASQAACTGSAFRIVAVDRWSPSLSFAVPGGCGFDRN